VRYLGVDVCLFEHYLSQSLSSIGYLVTISFSMVKVLEQVLLTGDAANDEGFLISLLLTRNTWVIGALISVLPFSFYRTLDELKKASALALVFVFILVCMILAYANGIADPCMGESENGEGTCKGDVEPYTNFALTVSRLPVFVFAFSCHQNIFPIVNEMEIANQKRLDIVISISIGFALVLYATVAFEGYRTYGAFVRGDILLNYPENGPVTFLRLCIAFMLTLHYPLHLDPSRRCLTSLVKVILKWWHQQPIDPNANDGESSATPEMEREDSVQTLESELFNDETSHFEMSNERRIQQQTHDDDRLFYIITISFLASSFILASIVDDLGVILALVGATGSTLVSFVLPGLIYIKLYPNKDLSLVMAYVQLLLGIVITPLALYLIIIEHLNK
jgi:amino acid permease